MYAFFGSSSRSNLILVSRISCQFQMVPIKFGFQDIDAQ
jgi:hypothetical protein